MTYILEWHTFTQKLRLGNEVMVPTSYQSLLLIYQLSNIGLNYKHESSTKYKPPKFSYIYFKKKCPHICV